MSADWAMVIITAVYVVATIFICKANIQSAKASKKQLDEMQRQFAEQNRPNIEVEYVFLRRKVYAIRFVNHGNCSAHHVKIELNSEFIDTIPDAIFQNFLRKQIGKECIIGAGQHIDLLLGFGDFSKESSNPLATGRVCYEGNGQKYETGFNIDSEQYSDLLSINSEADDLIKEIKEINETLKKIDNTIRTSVFALNKENKNV